MIVRRGWSAINIHDYPDGYVPRSGPATKNVHKGMAASRHMANLLSSGLVNEIHKLFWRSVVRPPICCLCDWGFEAGHECALVAFTQVPEDVANSLRRGCENPPEHPAHLEWFCPQHIRLATQLVHLTCKQAVTQLQSLGVDESNSAAERPILDDLFLSECPDIRHSGPSGSRR